MASERTCHRAVGAEPAAEGGLRRKRRCRARSRAVDHTGGGLLEPQEGAGSRKVMMTFILSVFIEFQM